MIENKEQFNVDQEVEMTLWKIRELDMRYQAIMAGQGHGYNEEETVDEMEQMAESIGMTLEDAYEYAEEYRNRLEEAAHGYGY
tara:strand:+ start:95 stop:343 length:249 start_codon:yes stop_codon:yes gene_type:complete